jgi:3-dehydroquinate dehydratase/shikimate dehydrogenase
MAQLVETVTGPTMADLRAARDAAVGDLVELRLDTVTDLDVDGALAGRRRPVIVTCRPRWEGGGFDGTEADRLAILGRAAALGAECIDVEFRAAWREVSRGSETKLVISSHDFDGVPADLRQRVDAMRRTGADVVKVAATANRLRDCVTLRDAMGMGADHVAIAMGAAGEISRACPWLFGSCWMYGGSAAPGQIGARTLLEVYRVHATGQETALYAIGGRPIGHSASPAIHNAAFAALGINAVFVRLETDDAAEFLAVADAFGVAGAAITAPLKSGFTPLGVRGDDDVTRIGALNTLRRGASGWEGRNFDVAGFLAPLHRRGHALRGQRALVLGAGGAARAAAWALAREGATVVIAARQPDRAARVALDLQLTAAPWPPEGSWDLVVNATPVGTTPATDDRPIEMTRIAAPIVYDLVYNPEHTALLADAGARGAETIGGLEMLIAQASCQFEWWTGRRAPAAVIEAGARAGIQGAQAAA